MKDFSDVPAYSGDNLDQLLNEMEAGTGALETKAGGPARLQRRAAPGADSAGGGDVVKQTVIEIGKEVLRQGQLIDRMAADGTRPGLKAAATPRAPAAPSPRSPLRLTRQAGDPDSAKEARERLVHAWEGFKAVNDRRLGKSRVAGDPLDADQLGRINGVLDRLTDIEKRISAQEVKGNRPPGLAARLPGLPTGLSFRKAAQDKLRKAVIHYMRTGDETFEGEHLRVIQKKALHTELNPDGGYLVLPERENSPLRTFLTELSMMRQRATVREISTSELLQPMRTGGAAAGWVAERGGRPETGTPTLGLDKYATMELYAQPGATQTMLDDAIIDIEAWLAEEVAEAMALQESDAWFNGDGVTKPRGLLTYPFVIPANWAHGSFRFRVTGAASGFAGTNPGDALINQQYELKAAHRQNASWLMTRATVGEVRKFKDTTGQYLWQPSLVAGQPPTLLAYPVDEDEFMVDIGTDTFPVGFGDWRKTYIIVDRIGVRVLRDPYTQKPLVLFYTTKRVGGGVQNFDAAVFLKCST
jgi:HK97 family phage major capsid protein